MNVTFREKLMTWQHILLMRNDFVCIVLIKSQVETRNTKRMYVDCRAKVDQM